MENKKLILLVDDSPEMAQVLGIYLRPDFELKYFENPVLAITWLQEGTLPDLIISDIKMPKMSGYEFLRYLKSSMLYKDIPVLMLSGIDSSSDRIQLLEDGAIDFILKPFNPMEIRARVKNHIRQK
jgi:DNA-binding response OmpR family regulator